MVEARQRSILWMLGVTLLVTVSLGWGAQAVEAVVAQPPVAETGAILDYLTSAVPEIREMARKNPDNRLILSVESAPDPQAAERADREFYRVYVGFYVQDGGPGHRSRWFSLCRYCRAADGHRFVGRHGSAGGADRGESVDLGHHTVGGWERTGPV